ncbi:MAG: HAD hydrolase family protein [bacterium]
MIIFTDLDGTLLDRQAYSYREAEPALDLIKKRDIPLIFCSAKTRAQQEVYRKELDFHGRFIVEDGGAVFVGMIISLFSSNTIDPLTTITSSKSSQGGRFYAVMGSNDKGKAVSLLTDLYRKQHGVIWTVGIGDSENDAPLLAAVDLPVLVQKPNAT